MTAYVIVELEPSAAGARREPISPARRFAEELRVHGATALPGDDPAGASATITVAVADYATAERLAAALRARDDVRTAYAKPGEALP